MGAERISPEEVESESVESRFGDKEHAVEVMKSGDVELLGDIDDVVPDIAPHANEIQLANVKIRQANDAQLVKVGVEDGNKVVCVFKPFSGESERVKKDFRFQQFYPRECAAYIISEHFGFDIVPPTIIREVNGERGSLQLFLDHRDHSDYDRIFSRDDIDEIENKVMQGEDYRLIAMMDWITANCDRNGRNIMYRESEPTMLFAIDHGLIMNEWAYARHAVRGPSRNLTYDNPQEEPVSNPVPDKHLEMLKRGMEDRDTLTATLLREVDGPDGVSEEDIEAMWQRLELMLEHGKYLSPKNFQQSIGQSIEAYADRD